MNASDDSPAVVRQRRYRWWALLWTLAILVGCSVPGQELPAAPFFSFDKVIHLVVFAGFGWLWMQTQTWSGRAVAGVVLFGLLYAIGTELYQGWMPIGRSADPYDALADVAGLLAGVAAAGWQHRRRTLAQTPVS
ncbi:MAG: VanZ family protein [Bacteroidota bacterium]